MMEHFAKIVDGWKSWTIFLKPSVIRVWGCSEDASAPLHWSFGKNLFCSKLQNPQQNLWDGFPSLTKQKFHHSFSLYKFTNISRNYFSTLFLGTLRNWSGKPLSVKLLSECFLLSLLYARKFKFLGRTALLYTSASTLFLKVCLTIFQHYAWMG